MIVVESIEKHWIAYGLLKLFLKLQLHYNDIFCNRSDTLINSGLCAHTEICLSLKLHPVLMQEQISSLVCKL